MVGVGSGHSRVWVSPSPRPLSFWYGGATAFVSDDLRLRLGASLAVVAGHTLADLVVRLHGLPQVHAQDEDTMLISKRWKEPRSSPIMAPSVPPIRRCAFVFILFSLLQLVAGTFHRNVVGLCAPRKGRSTTPPNLTHTRRDKSSFKYRGEEVRLVFSPNLSVVAQTSRLLAFLPSALARPRLSRSLQHLKTMSEVRVLCRLRA